MGARVRPASQLERLRDGFAETQAILDGTGKLPTPIRHADRYPYALGVLMATVKAYLDAAE